MGAEVDEETKGSMRTTIKKTASGDGARCATPGWRGSGHEGTQGRRRAVRLDFTPPGRGHPGRRRASRRDPGHSADRPPDRHMDCAPSPAEGLTRRVLPPRLRRLSSAPRQIPVVCGPHRVGRGRDIERHRTHTVVNVTGCLWFPPARTAALGTRSILTAAACAPDQRTRETDGRLGKTQRRPPPKARSGCSRAAHGDLFNFSSAATSMKFRET